jgi:hypothetical protein
VRLFGLLLLAAIAGFAVGRLTAPGEGGRGGGRAAAIAPPEARALALEENAGAEATPAAPEVEAPATPAGVVLPSEPSDEPERGTLVVDMEGVPGDRVISVGSVGILGGFDWDQGEEAWEGDVVTHWTEPGTCDVWWLDAEGRRLGTRVKLEAGKVTRVRAADHRAEAPIPRGLGVLSLFVEAAGGGGLSTEVSIYDERGDLPVWTNALGHGSTVIRPGRYSVTVGSPRSWAVTTPREVAVEEGRTTSLRIAHVREGDLVLVADWPLDISVHPVGGRPHSSEVFIWDNDSDWMSDASNSGATFSLPYLAEGEYEILAPFSLGAPIARFAIHEGQVTRVRCEMPKGGVRVRLTVPEGSPSDALEIVLRLTEPIAGRPSESMNAAAGSPFEIALPPGRYRVTARYQDAEEGDGTAPAQGSGEVSAEIEVQDRIMDVALELPRPH